MSCDVRPSLHQDADLCADMVKFCVENNLVKANRYRKGAKYTKYLVEWEERLTHARSYEEITEMSKTGEVADKNAMKAMSDNQMETSCNYVLRVFIV